MGKEKSALDMQVGGSHYKGFSIQPIEYIIKNGLSFPQGDIIKRITRYNQPGGKGLEDLRKIKHVVDLMIELQEKKKDYFEPTSEIEKVNEGDQV